MNKKYRGYIYKKNAKLPFLFLTSITKGKSYSKSPLKVGLHVKKYFSQNVSGVVLNWCSIVLLFFTRIDFYTIYKNSQHVIKYVLTVK